MPVELGPMTKAFAAAADANPDRIVVTEDQQELINAMTMAVWDHIEARRILSAPGGIETCCQWTDTETGLPCKSRLDKYTDAHILADLKTTLDARPRQFMNAAISYGYHRQAAWYRRGYRAATGYTGPLPFRFIAVEKNPPFVVAVYEIPEEDLDIVDRENQKLLRTWAECVAADNYPGYSDECRMMQLPEYALHDDGDDPALTLNGEGMEL
jgi:exodeoxyribonuclease VIII